MPTLVPCPALDARPTSPRPAGSSAETPLTLCDLTQSYAAAGGGIRTYLHEKRRYLMERTPHRHLLIVPGDADTTTEDGRATTVTVRSPFMPGSAVYRLMLRSRAVRRALARHRPDVIECQDAYNLPWAALRHRGAHPGVAVVGGYRTDFPRAYVRTYGQALLGRVLPAAWARGLAARAERRADAYAGRLYARMDAVYALGTPRAHALARLGVPTPSVLPLGVDLDAFSPERRDAQARADWGVGDDAPVLIYAGRLDSEKRPDLVLDAFERLPRSLRATLVLIGDGPMREALATRGATLTAGGRRVVMTGYVRDRRRLGALLASADVYVSAMAHETFGISILEAQAAGLPVVGVRAGAMLERVPPGLGRLVAPGDAAALAAGVEAVLAEDPRGVGAGARAHVEAEYGWDATFERLLALTARARAVAACR